MKKGENDERQKEKGGCQKTKIQAFRSSLCLSAIRLIWMKPEPDLNELSRPSHELIRWGACYTCDALFDSEAPAAVRNILSPPEG